MCFGDVGFWTRLAPHRSLPGGLSGFPPKKEEKTIHMSASIESAMLVAPVT